MQCSSLPFISFEIILFFLSINTFLTHQHILSCLLSYIFLYCFVVKDSLHQMLSKLRDNRWQLASLTAPTAMTWIPPHYFVNIFCYFYKHLFYYCVKNSLSFLLIYLYKVPVVCEYLLEIYSLHLILFRFTFRA